MKRGFEVRLAGWIRFRVKGNKWSKLENKINEELKRPFLNVFRRVV